MTRVHHPVARGSSFPLESGSLKKEMGGGGTRFALLLGLSLLALLLPGCLVGPNYTRPKVEAPPAYRGPDAAAQQASLADLPWWEIFKDETLKELVKTALANNYDVRIAAQRVERARQIAAETRSQFFPFVNYGAGISDGKNEFVGAVAPSGGTTQGAFLGGVSVAWEADIWGRIRRLNEASKALYLSQEHVRRGVMLTLVSDVAQSYFELLALDLQLEIARRTTASFDDTLKLFTQRLEGGVASKLDTSRAAGAQALVAASIPELERLIALKENQISVLLGQNPGPVPHNAKLLDQIIPPDVPAGLPSALLERRPDVRAAEEQVRLANARVGVATADYFPRIGLTTFLGHASAPLSDFASGQANVWSVAGNVAGPLYQGGALKARKASLVAAWEQSRLEYQATALNAFQDVSNALISRQKYDSIRTEQERAVHAYEDSVKVSLQRYIAGKASYYEVLESQQQLFPAETSLAQTELNRRAVIVFLYKALGGGWNLQDAQWTGPQAAAPAQGPTGQAKQP